MGDATTRSVVGGAVRCRRLHCSACGLAYGIDSQIADRDGVLLRDAGPIARLIESIQGNTERPVVDGTGLSGLFEWEVKFLPAAVARRVPAGASWGAAECPPRSANNSD
jgi:hypothetical protein